MKNPSDDLPSLADRAFGLLQQSLPTRALSSGMLALAKNRNPVLSRLLIEGFAKRFRIDMTQAQAQALDDYDSFASFFTRALKPGARPLPTAANVLVSPVDGCVSQCGAIKGSNLIQAKGKYYEAAELLGDTEAAEAFENGSFATIYLSPRDYHRVHMPIGGELRQWSYVPGRLFGVNPSTVRAMPGVFVRNERLCAIFDTTHGPLAVVLVGAFCVGGLESVWTGPITRNHEPAGLQYPSKLVQLARGEELGRFNLGSTVILLLPPGAAKWHSNCTVGATLRMGEAIATLKDGRAAPRKRTRRKT